MEVKLRFAAEQQREPDSLGRTQGHQPQLLRSELHSPVGYFP
jgi:hypothetical protein